tara:strand:+ start:1790 stop:2176 length:387 start_codon:yes stop_codon:yes gene_type:complete
MITEIISGILIGTIDDGYDKSVYDKHSIDIIMNCSIDKPFIDVKYVKKIRLPINTIEILKVNINKILDVIKENYLQKNILILSNEDTNLIIVCVFLIKYGNISVVDIKNIIKIKNNTLSIDRNLLEFL